MSTDSQTAKTDNPFGIIFLWDSPVSETVFIPMFNPAIQNVAGIINVRVRSWGIKSIRSRVAINSEKVICVWGIYSTKIQSRGSPLQGVSWIYDAFNESSFWFITKKLLVHIRNIMFRFAKVFIFILKFFPLATSLRISEDLIFPKANIMMQR